MADSDYVASGYNQFLKREDVVPAGQNGILEDAVSLLIPQISSSSIIKEMGKEQIRTAVGDVVQITGTEGLAGSLSISLGNGQQATLTSTIADSINPLRKMLGVCEITAYQDHLGMDGYRIPHNTGLNNYSVYGSFDYHANQISARPAQGLTFTHIVRNTSGLTHTVYWYLRWRYIGAAAKTE